MSTTADLVIVEARKTLGDTNAERSIIDPEVYRQAVNRQVNLVAKELGVNPYWATNAILTSTTDYDIEFASTSEYERILQLVYASDRHPLTKVSLDEILADRIGTSSPAGRPYKYAMDVDSSGRVVVMFGTLPRAGEYINAYLTTMPEAWTGGATVPPTIPFAESAVRALELLVAVDIAAPLGDDILTALDLAPKAIGVWKDMAMELIRLERLTIIRMKRTRSGSHYSWFSDWSRR